jgi:tetratricopeptide (TPR) repeat protein
MYPVPEDSDGPPVRPRVEAHEWQRALAALDLAQATGDAQRWSEALAQLGRCEHLVGNLAAAAQRFDAALHWARTLGGVDLLGHLLCERGELAADLALDASGLAGEPDPDAWLQARACAAEASVLAARTSDAGWEVQLLLRASALFKRLGRASEAMALQTRALQRQGGQVPVERPAVAQVATLPTLH